MKLCLLSIIAAIFLVSTTNPIETSGYAVIKAVPEIPPYTPLVIRDTPATKSLDTKKKKVYNCVNANKGTKCTTAH